MAAFVVRQVVSSMKNEQQSQNLLLKVDQRCTFRKNFLQPATNVFVAGQVDGARWKTGNTNMERNSVARQVEGFCISYFATFSQNTLLYSDCIMERFWKQTHFTWIFEQLIVE